MMALLKVRVTLHELLLLMMNEGNRVGGKLQTLMKSIKDKRVLQEQHTIIYTYLLASSSFLDERYINNYIHFPLVFFYFLSFFYFVNLSVRHSK